MKGEFSKGGSLCIERAGTMIEQFCCFAHNAPCSDECPQVGMVEKMNDFVDIAICMGKTLEFTEFTDNREHK